MRARSFFAAVACVVMFVGVPAVAEDAAPALSPSEAVVVESTGTFAEPALVLPSRATFGLDAAKPNAVATVQPAPVENMVFVHALVIACGISAFVTMLLCVYLSKTINAIGERTRAITVGCKLAFGFGTLVTLLLGSAAATSWSYRKALVAHVEHEARLSELWLVQSFATTLNESRLASRAARMKTNDETLATFTSSIGAVRSSADALKASLSDPKYAESLGAIDSALDSYNKHFVETIHTFDQRTGMQSSQLSPTAARICALLDSVAANRAAESRHSEAANALGARVRFDSAQLHAANAMRSDDRALADRALEAVEEFHATLAAEVARERSAVSKRALAECQQAGAFYLDTLRECFETNDRAERLSKEMMQSGPKMVAATEKLKSLLSEEVTTLQSAAAWASREAKIEVTVFAACAALMGLFIGLTVVRSMSSAMRNVVSHLRSVAAGDLTVDPINSGAKDELGALARAADKVVLGLRDVIGEVATSAAEVSGAATQIAASSEEMSASVGEVARQCAQAAESASSAGSTAQSGGEVVKRTVDGMRDINEAVLASSQSVSTLGQRSEEIGTVIRVINDIAEQTNLLALNAAIEAARAGEHGRGFAVVADEVRKLAERTTKATEEVSASIKAIQVETRQAVDRMKRGTDQVQHGVTLAQQAGANLEQIVQGSTTVAGLIQTISAAAEEAGCGATQSASAAQQLSTKAEQLQAMVSRFRVPSRNSPVSGMAKLRALEARDSSM